MSNDCSQSDPVNPKKVSFEFPSQKIDSVICDLIATISHFSDEEFDACFVNLNETELETIVVKLIEQLRQTLSGYELALLLNRIRQN